jgi:ATP-dependent DNA helicase DinG
VWTQICSEAHICTQKTCGQDSRCFYQQARKRLLGADVLVINHTLLFIMLISPEVQEERESGFIFPNDFLILDEAHTVEQVASRQIGIGISQYGLRSTIQRLYNARTRKGLFTATRDAEGVRLAAELVDDAEEFLPRLNRDAISRKAENFVSVTPI